jgi:hypothetical protein
MADHSNHYERAFSAYLRLKSLPCIPIDESHRALWQEESVKSPDFIVADGKGGLLLIDVKGRRLPRRRSTRQNWVTQDDVQSLTHWEDRFRPSSIGLFAFVFKLEDDAARDDFTDRWVHEDVHYGCLTVSLEDYSSRMRTRSARWKTVSLRSMDFASTATPLSRWFIPQRRKVHPSCVDGCPT